MKRKSGACELRRKKKYLKKDDLIYFVKCILQQQKESLSRIRFNNKTQKRKMIQNPVNTSHVKEAFLIK